MRKSKMARATDLLIAVMAVSATSTAAAQDAPAPAAQAAPVLVDPAQVPAPPGAAIATEATPSLAPELAAAPVESASASFTDAEIGSFVTAAVAVRAMEAQSAGDPTATPESKNTRAMQILADAGIDAGTYNAIGRAMRVDTTVMQRVQAAVSAHRAAQ